MLNDKDFKSDDELLMAFFDAARPDIPDEGFSRRVMRGLPPRACRINRVWSAACVAVGVVMLVLFDGVGDVVRLFGRLGAVAHSSLLTAGNAMPSLLALAGAVAVVGLVWLGNEVATQR